MRYAFLIAALVFVAEARADKFAVISTNAPLVWQSTESAPAAGTDLNIRVTQPFPNGAPAAEAELSADQQPTPWDQVAAMLNALNPKPHEVFLDPGCGPDARLLISAVRYFNVQKAIGVEIDAVAAASARRHVAAAGYANRITIIDGDSTKMALTADVAACYMWEDVLAALKPQLEKCARVVSYAHKVPGLPMRQIGDVWIYERPSPQAVMQQVSRQVQQIPYAVYRGRKYYRARPNCNCEMCREINSQLDSFRASTSARSGHWETRKVCRRGAFGQRICSTQRVWVPE